MSRPNRLSPSIKSLAVLGGAALLAQVATPVYAAPVVGHATVATESMQKIAARALQSRLNVTTEYFKTSNAKTVSSAAQRDASTVDATAQAIKDSFKESGLSVLDATSSYSNLKVGKSSAGIAPIEADITYTWKLRDASGTVTESSATDHYSLRVKVANAATDSMKISDEAAPSSSAKGDPKVAPPMPAASTQKPSAAEMRTAAQRSQARVAAAATYAPHIAALPASMENLNYGAEVNYALLWTDSAHANQMNPSYPVFDNNCANFVSQSLHAGGWQYRQGYIPSTLTNWAPNLNGPAGSSYTWGGAKYLATFVWNTGGKSYLDNIWNAGYGDIYFIDWDPNGKADGSIDHAALVTGYSGGPLVTQKSNNRHNVPLATYIAIAKSQGKTQITWYGART